MTFFYVRKRGINTPCSLKAVFEALTQAGLTLKPSKAKFGYAQVKYLGYVISPSGISVFKDRIQAIVDFPQPPKVKELRSVQGAFNYVRRLIQNYSSVV